MEIKRVLVPYSKVEDRTKLENYIERMTGRKVELGPIGYGGDLTLQTINVDLSGIGRTNITYAHYFPGKHFRNVDEFIEWHENLQNRETSETPEERRVTADMLNQMIDDECRRRGLPLIKHSNKTGTKVIVGLSLPKQAGSGQIGGQEKKDRKQ
ncbi:MAG: hypothetical protein IJI44_00415 [Erysipelotrichaceae bacterium]|nr:hypothetical protein [Erysipelotrichaceae bacterium]